MKQRLYHAQAPSIVFETEIFECAICGCTVLPEELDMWDCCPECSLSEAKEGRDYRIVD